MPEEDAPAFPNPENREQIPELTMDQLPSELGFSETPQMLQLKEPLVKAFADTGDRELLLRLLNQYHDLAEELIDQIPDRDKSGLTIGYALAVALMRRDAGRLQDYLADLEEIRQSTKKGPLRYILSTIDTEISRLATQLN